MLEQDRINAMISYFFLGPIFLLAKKGTPLAEPYVRNHAKNASIIILISASIAALYSFIRPYIGFPFFGFDIGAIILAAIMAGCRLFLMRGAYRAYRGDESLHQNIELGHNLESLIAVSGIHIVETEEDKSRILASMLPYVGIYLAEKYRNPLMVEARIIGSFFTFLFAVSLFITSAEGFLSFIITIIYITIFVVEGVYLFIYGRFVSWAILEKIPSYNSIEAHIVASFRSSVEFISIVFGRSKQGNYALYFEEAIRSSEVPLNTPKYFMPANLIGVPVWNIFSFPSFFLTEYKPYRPLILQGFLITVLFVGLFLLHGSNMEAGFLLLLFPIAHILVFGKNDISTRAPILSIWMHCKRDILSVHDESEESPSTSSPGLTSPVTSTRS